MSRFNKTQQPAPLTTNFAGGDAHSQSPELELISILLTSFGEDTFYRSGDATFQRLYELTQTLPLQFVCKAGIYARTVFGMRTISHVLAACVAARLSKQPFAASFYDKIVYRVDDMAEILSYYTSQFARPGLVKRKSGKPRYKYPVSMLRGFAKAFDRFNGYHFAKYRSEDKEFKLVDVVNLVHPKPTEQNGVALAALLKSELKNTETWEAMLSAATDKSAKAMAWDTMLHTKKLGYLALLRNLRNIMQDAPGILHVALDQLTDPGFIKKSLILPIQFQTAMEQIMLENSGAARNIVVYLNKAVDLSCDNVPFFEGETLVVLDVSSSMLQNKVAKIGALFSAVILKRNNCDFMTFDGAARYIPYNLADSTMTISKLVNFNGGSTNFHSIFDTADKKYDRIIILSDMQGWTNQYKGLYGYARDTGDTVPKIAFDNYKKRTGADPFIYSFDLAGLGTTQFPERKVFALAGFSDKVFSIMQLLEIDKNALINTIKAVEL